MGTKCKIKFFLATYIAIFVSKGCCKRIPNNQIRRDLLSKEAIFLKKLEDVEIKGNIVSYQDNTTLALCARSCLREPVCETFNYRRSPIPGCKIINGTVESSEIFAVPNEGWDYYAPQKKRELPCKLLKDGKNADLYSKALYGRVLTTDNAGPLCDFTSDEGGWTLISSYDHSRYVSDYTRLVSDDITKMAQLETTDFLLGSAGFKNLYRMFNFRQVRFYCRRRSDGLVLDLATADNEIGDGVLLFLLGFAPSNRPPSCGSYYQVPPSSTYLGRACTEWADQKWRMGLMFIDNPFYIPSLTHFAPLSYYGGCDNTDYNTANPNIFKIYVR